MRSRTRWSSPGATSARFGTPTRGTPGSTASPCGPAIARPARRGDGTWSSCTWSPTATPSARPTSPGRLGPEVLAAALERLPYDQRVVMVLHFHLDLPLTEAAAILDIPVGTAKSRLHRGLAALRTTLGAEPGRELGSVRERPA